MFNFRSLGIVVSLTLMLAAAPGTRAQSAEDMQLMRAFLDIMTDYLTIIESTHGIASDSEKAAIMQMQKIQEIYEERGEKARSAEVLKRVLEDSNNQTIRNAAYMLLGDTLKETGRADEALQYLQRGLAENIGAADR